MVVLIVAGYFFLYLYADSIEGHTVCFFKNVTGIPCPACGSTRATVQLMHGHVSASFFINPFGILTNLMIIGSVGWMVRDVVRKKETFFPFLKKDWSGFIKIIVIVVVVANWIWNIEKGL